MTTTGRKAADRKKAKILDGWGGVGADTAYVEGVFGSYDNANRGNNGEWRRAVGALSRFLPCVQQFRLSCEAVFGRKVEMGPKRLALFGRKSIAKAGERHRTPIGPSCLRDPAPVHVRAHYWQHCFLASYQFFDSTHNNVSTPRIYVNTHQSASSPTSL
ncbi:hypothetical protein AOQ84DRAFT_361288 [Glonium stellatum]|uniref:Uncharacterized protein n=1 Tax=Glonium stellatum TaxID=574774 RepID=A0A8E2F6Y5_9PEZI|nr:hypothetical protein AOQ84DRAFT_361288 [Glonium stellatum]